MRVGIVGCGKIAHRHAPLIREHAPDAQVVFCDRNIERAEALAGPDAPEGSVYTNVSQMLAEANLDSVHVLTQVAGHFDVAKQALNSGAHVYIEKPVVNTIAEFDVLVALAKEQDRHLQPGYSALGSPGALEAKTLIESKTYGDVISVHCDYNWAAKNGGLLYGGGHHWAYSLPGGILQNLADHPASLVLEALDDIDDSTVHVGWRQDLPSQSPDFMHAVVQNSRQVGSFTMVLGHGNTQAQILYFLEKATIRVDLRSDIVVVIPGSGPQSLPARTLTNLRTSAQLGFKTSAYMVNRASGRLGNEPGVAGMVKNFYDVVARGEKAAARPATARNVIGLLERAWQQVEQDQPVTDAANS